VEIATGARFLVRLFGLVSYRNEFCPRATFLTHVGNKKKMMIVSMLVTAEAVYSNRTGAAADGPVGSPEPIPAGLLPPKICAAIHSMFALEINYLGYNFGVRF
jgi:hypothetical protein